MTSTRDYTEKHHLHSYISVQSAAAQICQRPPTRLGTCLVLGLTNFGTKTNQGNLLAKFHEPMTGLRERYNKISAYDLSLATK